MKNKKFIQGIFLFSTLLLTSVANAETAINWSEIRIFGSANKFATAPDALNTLTSGAGVQTLDSMAGFGLEADAIWHSWLKFGIRYKGIWTMNTPPGSSSTPTAYLAVQQSEGGLLLRIPIINSDVIQLDIFGEGGMANTHVDVQTGATSKATYSKGGNFYQRAGASLGLGWKSWYVFFEAGQEWNNLGPVTYSGNIGSSITAIDLSGPYYSAGIIIAGVPSWMKIGGVSKK